jgi:hypothetical protein
MPEESGQIDRSSPLDVDSLDQSGINNVQAEFIGKSEDKYQNLLKELEPSIQAEYTKRCEEAVKEGDDLIQLGFLGRCDEAGKCMDSYSSKWCWQVGASLCMC